MNQMKIMEIKIIRIKNLVDGLNGRLETFETKINELEKKLYLKPLIKDVIKRCYIHINSISER